MSLSTSDFFHVRKLEYERLLLLPCSCAGRMGVGYTWGRVEMDPRREMMYVTLGMSLGYLHLLFLHSPYYFFFSVVSMSRGWRYGSYWLRLNSHTGGRSRYVNEWCAKGCHWVRWNGKVDEGWKSWIVRCDCGDAAAML